MRFLTIYIYVLFFRCTNYVGGQKCLKHKQIAKTSRKNFFFFILQSYNFAQSWLDFAQTNVRAYATFKNSGVDYLYAESAKQTFIRLVMRLVCPLACPYIYDSRLVLSYPILDTRIEIFSDFWIF